MGLFRINVRPDRSFGLVLLYLQELRSENNEQLRLCRALHLQKHCGANQGNHRVKICDNVEHAERNPEGCLLAF
jgi:hypothetical protein